MVSDKVADRLIRDLPEMSTDELNLTIDMANDARAEAMSFAELDAANKLRKAISAELKRHNPKGTDGP